MEGKGKGEAEGDGEREREGERERRERERKGKEGIGRGVENNRNVRMLKEKENIFYFPKHYFANKENLTEHTRHVLQRKWHFYFVTHASIDCLQHDNKR